MPERSKLGRLFALLAVVAIVVWTLLPVSQGDLGEDQQLAQVRGSRSAVVLTDEPALPEMLVGAEAKRTAQRTYARQSMPARRGELDVFSMPFPFSGRCVANGRSVAGATVHYKGETRTTDESGRFSFPSYGYALRVLIEAEGYGQLVATSSKSKMTFQMQPPAIGRVIVRSGLERVEAVKVTVYLLPETVMISKRRTLLRDLPIVGEEVTDANGFAFFESLPTYDRIDDIYGLLYCVIEFPDGTQHESCLIPRKQDVSRGEPRVEWSRDFRKSGVRSSNLRVERRNEHGIREPVPGQLVYFRVNSMYFSPWHVATTNAYGMVMIREREAHGLQVIVPINENTQWSSITDPLIDLGNVVIALIESEEQSVQLLNAPSDDSIRFQVQRMASASEDGPGPPRSTIGVVELSEWGWQDCRPGELTQLISGVVGKNSWAWVRIQPGNLVIASKRLNAHGHTDFRLPELARLSVVAGAGQRFPLGTRVWLIDSSARKLPPLILDPRGSNFATGWVPYGTYELMLVTTGVQHRKLSDLRIDSAEQEFSVDFPQSEATLELSVGTHLLTDFELRIDGTAIPRRSDERGELPIQGALGDSIFVQLPASSKLGELDFPGRPELLFLGYEARIPFAQEGMYLHVPLGSLFFEVHPQDGGKLRLSRRDSTGAALSSIELTLPRKGAVLARSLPAGRYRIETDFRAPDVAIDPVERVQVDADDR